MHQRIFLIMRLFKISFRIRLTPSKETFNDYIVLNNVDVKSQIEYLSEYGVLVSQVSSEEKLGNKVLIGTSRAPVREKYGQGITGARQGTFTEEMPRISSTRLLIVDQTDEGSDSLDTEKQSRHMGNTSYPHRRFLPSSEASVFGSFGTLGLESIEDPRNSIDHVDVHAKEAFKKDLEVESMPLRFSVSKVNFYVLKYALGPNSRVRIVMDYTEAENPPIALQFFLHLPLLITSIIIVVLVMTFETGIDKDVIAEEISKLPLQKYTSNLEFQECPICLDLFCMGDEVRVLSCKHCFHRNCIDSWLVNLLKCPLCRNSVTKLADTPSYEIYQTITNL